MTVDTATRVSASHLARTAFLYVRQSTLRQVINNTESTTRQYALRQRAVAFGWSAEQIVTIDCDQGQSGASAADREGFQRLVAEVGMGRAGIVLGLEVSRLARNNADWHRLLEICALTDTLICDEDGLYNPASSTTAMSEAELHFIRARLRGGQLSKARRGELPVPLPVGGVGGERLLVRLELLPGDCKHANNPAAGAQLVLGAKDEVLYIGSGLASRIERGVVDFDTGEGFHGLIAFDIVPESEIPLEAQFRGPARRA